MKLLRTFKETFNHCPSSGSINQLVMEWRKYVHNNNQDHYPADIQSNGSHECRAHVERRPLERLINPTARCYSSLRKRLTPNRINVVQILRKSRQKECENLTRLKNSQTWLQPLFCFCTSSHHLETCTIQHVAATLVCNFSLAIH